MEDSSLVDGTAEGVVTLVQFGGSGFGAHEWPKEQFKNQNACLMVRGQRHRGRFQPR